MERRIAGIIRWLERCLRAHKAGALESALMDVECARADIEHLRNEIWTTLEQKRSLKSRGKLSLMPLNAVLLALTVLLAAATPLALLQEMRERQEVAVTLEWVTPDEKMLLGNLRKHLSDNNSFTRLPAASAANKSIAPPPEKKRIEKDEMSVPYDRILSLVKAGEKALKNETPLIKIDRR